MSSIFTNVVGNLIAVCSVPIAFKMSSECKMLQDLFPLYFVMPSIYTNSLGTLLAVSYVRLAVKMSLGVSNFTRSLSSLFVLEISNYFFSDHKYKCPLCSHFH